MLHRRNVEPALGNGRDGPGRVAGQLRRGAWRRAGAGTWTGSIRGRQQGSRRARGLAEIVTMSDGLRLVVRGRCVRIAHESLP